MRNGIQAALLIGVFAAGSFLRCQDRPEVAPANNDLVPQDFTVDDVPISVKIPFKVFVNGKEWQGRSIGWAIHPDVGSTIWLGLPGRGMYLLSLAPRKGYNFQKAGAIRNNVIAFHDSDIQYEIRTACPIFGSDKAWNLYVLHLPKLEMKGPLFGVERLGSGTLSTETILRGE